MTSVADEVRRYWDADSVVYDDVPNHHPTGAAELAAWMAALSDLLPPAPSRVLDCGAGTDSFPSPPGTPARVSAVTEGTAARCKG